MNLEDLVEILTVWSIANGHYNMVAMLEGEKSVDEYIDGVIFGRNEYIKYMNKCLEEENECPNELIVECC